MLPKKNRLSLRKHPLLFKTNSRRLDSPTLSLLWNAKILDKDQNHNDLKLAVLVSKKVSKKAVTRNKIKRQIHQIVQEILPGIKNSLNILIITKPNILKLTKEELEEETKCTIDKISNF